MRDMYLPIAAFLSSVRHTEKSENICMGISAEDAICKALDALREFFDLCVPLIKF